MLVDIGEDVYYSKFPVDPHPFLSRKFLDLNKSKVDRIICLVNDSSKPSIGLIAGIKDGYLLSHFSAPFGGFHFSHELIYVSVINEFIQNLLYYIKTNGFSGIKITLPPNIYHQTMNSKLINSLFYSEFKLKTIDITSWIDLELFENRYNVKTSREHLNQAYHNDLNFNLLTQTDKKQEAYELIMLNRKLKNRPIYMTFADLEKLNSILNIDYFAVQDKNNQINASAIIYRTHKSIVYLVFWGDNKIGRPQRAMDFCIFNLLNYYKQCGYKYLDIGISTEKGIPNEGLLRFKETHEAISSLRYTFSWSNLQDSAFDSLTKKRWMEPINKYGIILRLVEEGDAEFILNLRTDSKLSKFISYTSPDIDEQIKWIRDYKSREKEGLEYYFIAVDQDGNRYGTIRLYNLDDKSFEIGSWLFSKKSPLGMAVKTHVLGYEIGFEHLKADYCRFEVRKQNTAVLKYVEFFQPKLVNDDNLNFYFILTKENFYQRKSKLAFFSSATNDKIKKITIHPTAEVQTKNIGEGTVIWQYCVILGNAVIGKNCNINYNVFIENDVIIGDNATIKSGVQLWDGIRLEDNVFISPNVSFTNDFAPRSKKYPDKFLSTTVKEWASIGANSTIIGGITIGKHAMIGAGSMVTKNIPDYNLWYGNPATFRGYVCNCGHKLNDSLICPACETRYKSTNGIISEL